MLEIVKVTFSEVTNVYFMAGLVAKIDRGQNLVEELKISKKSGIGNSHFKNHAVARWTDFLKNNEPNQKSIEAYLCVEFRHLRIDGQSIRFLDDPEWHPNIIYIHKKSSMAYARISKYSLQASLKESRFEHLRLDSLKTLCQFCDFPMVELDFSMDNMRQIKDMIQSEIIIYDEEGDLFYAPRQKFDHKIILKLSNTAEVMENFFLVFNEKSLKKAKICEKPSCSYATAKTSHLKRHLETCTDEQTFVEKQVISIHLFFFLFIDKNLINSGFLIYFI